MPSYSEQTRAVALTVRMPRELHERLTALAAEQLTSVNREIVIAVKAHLGPDEREMKP